MKKRQESAGADMALATRPTLAAWLREYDAIERDYIEAFRSRGVAFAPRGFLGRETAAAKRRLRAADARFRNGDASISCGRLSSACVACTGDCGSKTFFLSLECNRSCYFCFNGNQADYDSRRLLNGAWREELDAFFSACGGARNVTHIGLTGGEPLLHADQAVAFIAYAHERAPQAHLRMYTAGDFLDEALLARLRDAGLAELRISVKLDVLDDEACSRRVISEAARRCGAAARFIPQVMVEMPVIPGTDAAMRSLLRELDAADVFGVNLLEFGYPMGAWDEFGARGFQVKNPPFPVIYDWGYAGGLPIAGSELACLELVEFALHEGLRLGVHYCSLENKNRDQVFQQNRELAPDEAVYEQSADDFFFKTLKFFDGDAEAVAARIVDRGLQEHAALEEDGTLLVHPSYLRDLQGLDVMPALSINVVEGGDDGPMLRELKLELVDVEKDEVCDA